MFLSRAHVSSCWREIAALRMACRPMWRASALADTSQSLKSLIANFWTIPTKSELIFPRKSLSGFELSSVFATKITHRQAQSTCYEMHWGGVIFGTSSLDHGILSPLEQGTKFNFLGFPGCLENRMDNCSCLITVRKSNSSLSHHSRIMLDCISSKTFNA